LDENRIIAVGSIKEAKLEKDGGSLQWKCAKD
jgi:hypothetical protein